MRFKINVYETPAGHHAAKKLSGRFFLLSKHSGDNCSAFASRKYQKRLHNYLIQICITAGQITRNFFMNRKMTVIPSVHVIPD